MRLLIVSGTSGSGKSSALNLLEDLGAYCVDNLPVALLSSFARQILADPEKYGGLAAVGIDARNPQEELARFPAILAGLREAGLQSEVIFLDAEDTVLLKRFSDTRRKHPLTRTGLSLAEAIAEERRLLDPIAAEADLHLDTTQTSLHQLRELVRLRVARVEHSVMSLALESFGFKHGVPPGADFVFDVRCLPNPYWDSALRGYTGLEVPVRQFLDTQPEVGRMLRDIRQFLDAWLPQFEAANRSYLTIAVGCTGGQHRSVYMVERLREHLQAQGREILVRHRELS